MGWKILVAVVCLGTALYAGQVEAVSLRSAFKSISTETTWPVGGTDGHDLESAFGPRIKESTETYDWHAGVDIKAEKGTVVRASVNGTLEEVTEFANGGLTVILKHEFPEPVKFHGQSFEFYYSYYMHLSSVSDALEQASVNNEHPQVLVGQKVGEVGHSGTAIGDHLHLEVRVGTTCSLAYQIQHPDQGCAEFGFDPQVNPMFLFSEETQDAQLTLLSSEVGESQRIEYKSVDTQPLMNKIQWKVIKKSTGEVVHSKTLNLNTRKGFDPGEDGTFNVPDKSNLFVAPRSWGRSADWFRSVVVIPWSEADTFGSYKYKFRLIVTDIWGSQVKKTWEVGSH